jgi:hypothetical protein
MKMKNNVTLYEALVEVIHKINELELKRLEDIKVSNKNFKNIDRVLHIHQDNIDKLVNALKQADIITVGNKETMELKKETVH